MDPTPRSVRVAAVGLVAAIAAAFLLTGAFYNRAFSNPAVITVQADRAGLIMSAGNKVKANGVEIGRVGSVKSAGNHVELTLEIDRDALEHIPAKGTAELRGSTVFGAKYVELSSGAERGEHVRPGDTIRATAVTTEINTIFDKLDSVLSDVDVVALNTTLSTLSRALDGRGDDIAELASTTDAYLAVIEPQLPQLRRDLTAVARFADLADRVSPAFLKILENATVTGRTVTSQQQQLDRLLVDLTLLGDRGTELIEHNGKQLTRLVKNLQTPAATLRAYSSELPCFIHGAERTRQIMTNLFGKGDAGLRAELSFRSSSRTYTLPHDTLKVPTKAPANCVGLPVLPAESLPLPQIGEMP
jgi:phospholipid/cholesterol/gamma-HCH transport system substrate-binding protein